MLMVELPGGIGPDRPSKGGASRPTGFDQSRGRTDREKRRFPRENGRFRPARRRGWAGSPREARGDPARLLSSPGSKTVSPLAGRGQGDPPSPAGPDPARPSAPYSRPRLASWWPRMSRFRAACSTWRVASEVLAGDPVEVPHRLADLGHPGGLLAGRGDDLRGGPGGVGQGVGQGVDGLAGLAPDLDRRGDPLGHLLGREDRGVGRLLDLGEDLADPGGGLLRLVGQRLDLAGDDGEPPAVLAGPRGLDRGVEGQQVGLLGDVADARR